MQNNHDDLRKVAVEAVANYLHHSLFNVVPVNMMGWIRGQSEEIIDICDRAIAAFKAEGKRRGIL